MSTLRAAPNAIAATQRDPTAPEVGLQMRQRAFRSMRVGRRVSSRPATGPARCTYGVGGNKGVGALTLLGLLHQMWQHELGAALRVQHMQRPEAWCRWRGACCSVGERESRLGVLRTASLCRGEQDEKRDGAGGGFNERQERYVSTIVCMYQSQSCDRE
jgi:hypothetical protein